MGRRQRRNTTANEVQLDNEVFDNPEAVTRQSLLSAVHDLPYLRSGIRALTLTMSEDAVFDGHPTMFTDCRMRVFVHPEAIKNWMKDASEVSDTNPCKTCGKTSHLRQAYIGGVLLHELNHSLRSHADRFQNLGKHEDHKIWNIAADLEINDDLFEVFKMRESICCLPPNCVKHDMWKELTFDEGKLAEEYYWQIKDKAEQQAQQQKPDWYCGPCVDGDGENGSSGDQDGEDGQDGQGSAQGSGNGQDSGKPGKIASETEGVSKAEQQIIKHKVAQEIRKHAKTRGNMPGGFQIWAEEILGPPQVPWQQVLSRLIRRSVQLRPGSSIRTFKRLGRRTMASNMQVLYPSLRDPMPNVAIVQDTSGSMSPKDIGLALNEAEFVCKSIGAEVCFYSCDASVDSTKGRKTKSFQKIALTGGGGTDMRVGIDAAMNAQTKPDAVIVFTDAETPWPEQPFAGHTKLIIGRINSEAACPEWASVFDIKTESPT